MPARSSPAAASPLSRIPIRRIDWPPVLSGAILAFCTFAAFGRTFSVPLLFDDIFTIVNNATIRHWSTALWPPLESTSSGRPLLNLSFALNYAISGTQVWSYHALNLAIHVLAGLTLFGITRRTLQCAARALHRPPGGKGGPNATGGTSPSPTLLAFAVALLWSLHPLQTEAVTYVVQRAESLMGLFFLLTLYCFIRSVAADGTAKRGRVPLPKGAFPTRVPLPEDSIPKYVPGAEGVAGSETRPRSATGWAILCFLACLAGMATKEVMVSAPVIVFLYDRTFVAGSFGEAWRRRWRIHAGLAATWLLLLFLAVSTHGRNRTAGFGGGVSWWSYALTQLPAIAHYLRLCFWPHPLVFDYGTALALPSLQILPSALIVTGLVAASAWALFWRPAIGFLGAAFFAILAPSSSLIPVATQTMAEHRMYLPLIPVVVLVVLGFYRWSGRAALPFCLVLAAGLFATTWRRNEEYRSALSLWSDTVAKNPANARAHNALGNVWLRIPGRLNDAIAQYEKALRLDPQNAIVHNDLGYSLSKVPGRSNQAIAQYREALRLDPDYAEAYYNLGNAWSQIPGRLNEAIAQYQEALRLKPDYAEAHNNLGSAWMNTPGRLSDAIVQFQEALRLKPDYAEAHNNLGNAWMNAPGRLNDAIAQFQTALRLKPDDAGAHFNLAIALLNLPGRGFEAKEQLEAILRLHPENEAARQLLARINASPP